MVKKILKVVLKIFVFVITLVIVDALLISTLPFNLWQHQASKIKYNQWMEENLNPYTRLIDIKMLGAHDAFSYDISLSSKVDLGMVKADDTLAKLAASPFSFLYKGLLVRISKAQNNNVEVLLNQGVRYLDVRLSYDSSDQKWYTTHSFLSNDALVEFGKVSDFLETNKKEIVIFDIQHIFDDRNGDGKPTENTYEEVKQLLIDAKLYEKAVDFTSIPLKDMTYVDALNGSTTGKVVITMKNNLNDNKILDYNSSIRSSWANTISDDKIISFIEREVNYVKNDATLMNKFRVMQAQKTAQPSPLSEAYQTLLAWSLLSMAKDLNPLLLNNDKIDEYLDTLPIFMVDYASSNHKDFNDIIMNKIIELNNK